MHHRPTPLLCVVLFVLAAVPVLAAFPGTNGRIVFNLSGDLVAVDPDGTGLTQLTTGATSGHPNYSPDGQKIAYICASFTAICSMDADGSNSVVLISGLTGANWVDWHPGGARISYLAGGNVWTAQSNGSSPTQLTTGGGFFAADYSPDGTKLAIQTSSGVGVMDADGTNLVVLAPGGGSPDWSPDGQRIVYNLNTSGQRDIWTIKPDGSGLLRVTNDTKFERDAKWSPDGTRLIVGVDFVLTTMDPDGSNRFSVHAPPGGENPIWTDWQPVNTLVPAAGIWGLGLTVVSLLALIALALVRRARSAEA